MFSAPKCSKCCRNFSFAQAALQPLILSCGHSFCKQCIIKLHSSQEKEIVCPKCKTSTTIPNDDSWLKSLPLDFYLLGLALSTANQPINLFNNKGAFNAKDKENEEFGGKELKGGRPPCISCKQVPASCSCQQCDISVCEHCFAAIHHNQRGDKAHARLALVMDSIYGCLEHGNMAKEFWCKDDQITICAKCGLTGKHKGHNISHIHEKNAEMKSELQPTYDESKGVLKKLYKAKQDVQNQQIWVEKVHKSVINDIHAAFITYHAELQLRMEVLMNEAIESRERQQNLLLQIKNNLSGNICRLETVMKDAELGLSADTPDPSNLTELVSVLKDASSLPCYLAGATHPQQLIKFCEDRAGLSGALDVAIKDKWCLKSKDELPKDFQEPDIDDGILLQSSLFGAKPKRKTSSELEGSIRKLEKEGILPKKSDEGESIRPKHLISRGSHRKIANKELVRVVHITNPGSFYIHRQVDMPHLQQMMKTLQNVCGSVKDPRKNIPDPIQEGTKCCCKYDLDNQWYRAIVSTVPDDLVDLLASGVSALELHDGDDAPKVEVVYIDYGNHQWVPITRLQKLKPKLEREAAIAVCCSLYDIIPPNLKTKWPKESVEAFAAMIESPEPVVMSVHGKSENALYVDLHKSPNSHVRDDMPISIRDGLVFLEMANFVSQHAVTAQQGARLLFPARNYIPPETPIQGEKCGITVCNITDPHHFWVQEIGLMGSSLGQLMDEIQKVYEGKKNSEWKILCPTIDLICIANFSVDNKWYRAKVIGLPGKQMVEVIYVDWGNKAVIHVSELRKITEQFLRLPIMAIPCQLADVNPKDPDEGWSKEALKFFSHAISYKQLELSVHSDRTKFLSVVLFDLTDENRTNLNALLVQQGYAKSSGPASFSATTLRAKTQRSSEGRNPTSPRIEFEVPVSPAPVEESKKHHGYTKVNVSYVESPARVFIQLSTAGKDGLDMLTKEMLSQYKSSEPDMEHKWLEGSLCCALMVAEDRWCRAKIASVLPDGNCSVFFTDFGSKEVVLLKNLRTLEDRFAVEEPFAVQCHLSEVIPAGGQKGWTHTASQFLQDKMTSMQCYINQKGDMVDGSLPVDLLYELTMQEMVDQEVIDDLASVSELLIKEGLALRKRRKMPKSKGGIPAVSDQILYKVKTNPVKVHDQEKSNQVARAINVIPKSPGIEQPSASLGNGTNASKKSGEVHQQGVSFHSDGNHGDNNNTDIHVDDTNLTKEKFPPIIKRIRSPHPSPEKNKPAGGKESQQTAEVGCRSDNRSSPSVPLSPDIPIAADASIGQKPHSPEGTAVPSKELLQSEEILNGTDDKGVIYISSVDGTDVDVVENVQVVTHESPKQLTNQEDDIHDDRHEDDQVAEISFEDRYLSLSEEHAQKITAGTISEINSVAVDDPAVDTLNPEPDMPASAVPASVSNHLQGEATKENNQHQFSDEEDGVPMVQKYLPPEVPRTKQLNFATSFVSEEGVIHALDMENFEAFQRFMKELQIIDHSLHPVTPQMLPLQPGQAVCAQFSMDNLWYRSTVVKVEGNKVEVKYIDFGNSELVPMNRIDLCPFKLELPQQCQECVLYGIIPNTENKKWSAKAIAFLTNNIVEQPCKAFIKAETPRGDPLLVDMVLQRGGVIRQMLVENKYAFVDSEVLASEKSGERHFQEEVDNDDIFDFADCDSESLLSDSGDGTFIKQSLSREVSQECTNVQTSFPVKSDFPKLNFPLGWAEFLVEIPCIETPEYVYVMPSSTFSEEPQYYNAELKNILENFNKLHANLHELSANLPNITAPSPGMACTALFESDRQWYRGVILGNHQESEHHQPSCYVRFVDYGNVVVLPLNKIKYLPEQFKCLPALARLCRIEGLRPNPPLENLGLPKYMDTQWTQAAVDAMGKYVKNKIFIGTVLEDADIPIVSLHKTDYKNGLITRGVPIYQHLLESGLASMGSDFPLSNGSQ